MTFLASDGASPAEAAEALAESVALEREQHDLLQLLYLCPVAIVRVSSEGTILLMNPYGTQLLMPISTDGSLDNLFDLFEPFAPEVAEMSQRFEPRAGRVCEEHRVHLPTRPGSGRSNMIISITLQKVDSDMSVAILTDVTAAASRELAVRLSEERLHAVLDGLSQYSICTVDTNGLITSWNRAAERLDDYRSDETVGRHIDMLVSKIGSVKSPMGKMLEFARKNGSHQFEAWRIRKDGRRYWASTSVAMLYNKDGTTALGFSVIAHDLTEQRRAEDRLRVLAMTDPLTGALNRRSLYENAKQARARALDSNEWVAMLLLDADNFKAINDTHGHAAGDLTLQRIVEDCRKEIRSRDILGRVGGEEFAIFLPGCNTASAAEVAERICRRIAKPADSQVVPCTVSIGVAASQTADDSVDGLMRRADGAMYLAKANGRNRVMLS